MPDPQVLYLVTALVVLGLVAWVVVVLVRAPRRPPHAAPSESAGEVRRESKG